MCHRIFLLRPLFCLHSPVVSCIYYSWFPNYRISAFIVVSKQNFNWATIRLNAVHKSHLPTNPPTLSMSNETYCNSILGQFGCCCSAPSLSLAPPANLDMNKPTSLSCQDNNEHMNMGLGLAEYRTNPPREYPKQNSCLFVPSRSRSVIIRPNPPTIHLNVGSGGAAAAAAMACVWI